MYWIFIAIAGVLLASKRHCIVLPTTTSTPTTTAAETLDKPHLDPSLDALIREIFVANNSNDVEWASKDEHARIMKVSLCYGLIWFRRFLMHFVWTDLRRTMCADRLFVRFRSSRGRRELRRARRVFGRRWRVL